MKILIAYQYLSFKGGIEEVILESSKYLKKRGHDVEIMTFRFHTGDPSVTRDGVRVHRFPGVNVTYKYFGIPFVIPLLLPHVIKQITTTIKKCDIMNIHGHPYLASLLFLLVAKFLKKPVVLTQHNTRIRSPSMLVNTIYDLVDATYGKYILNASDMILCGSKETKKYIESISGAVQQKAVVLYNGVDSEKFVPVGGEGGAGNATRKDALRKKFGLATNRFICLTIRRITFKNGIDTLLKVTGRLDPTRFQVVIGGTGADMQKVQNYLTKKHITNVKLLGFVRDEDLPMYYALADCFILPSRKGEGFPMAVLEAFSSGLPVVATDSGGHTEIIKDKETGFVVPVGDDKEIAEKVTVLAEDKKLLKDMSTRTRKFIEQNINWDSYIDTFLTVAHKAYNGIHR